MLHRQSVLLEKQKQRKHIMSNCNEIDYFVFKVVVLFMCEEVSAEKNINQLMLGTQLRYNR